MTDGQPSAKNEPVIQFIVADRYKVDTSDSAPVKIAYVGEKFKSYFYGMTEITESKMPRFHHDLEKNFSTDMEIWCDLRHFIWAVVTLDGIMELLERQGTGREGPLLTNHCANIFFVCDKGGESRIVNIFWTDEGWYVVAHPIDISRQWPAGRRVFAR